MIMGNANKFHPTHDIFSISIIRAASYDIINFTTLILQSYYDSKSLPYYAFNTSINACDPINLVHAKCNFGYRLRQNNAVTRMKVKCEIHAASNIFVSLFFSHSH